MSSSEQSEKAIWINEQEINCIKVKGKKLNAQIKVSN